MASKIPSASTRPFRIFALPLARLPRGAARAPSTTTASASAETEKPATPLLLFQTSQPDPSSSSTPSLLTKALNKASDQWLKLGEKDKKSWMFWFYAKGEKLMDRIEYEEWALKGIKENEGARVDKEGKVLDNIQIPLLRPALKEPLPPLIPKLHRLLIHRIPYHKKMMYRSIIFSPLTWPFALIPVIPNFPMFYVLWRAWSHYKAYRGATYLETLLKAGLIVEQESKPLSEVYAKDAAELEISQIGKAKKDHAPDETSSEGVSVGTKSDPGSEVQKSGDATGKEEELNGQAQGKAAAPDGTATPSSLVYSASDSSSGPTSTPTTTSTSTSTSSSYASVPFPAPAPGPIDSKAKHPSLLLSPAHIPLLAKTFNLRPYEVMDITRAVEQADFRARKTDLEKANAQEAKEKNENEKSR